MKPSDITIQAPIFAQERKPSLGAVTTITKQWAVILGNRISKGITHLQIARMESVLQSMTDEQLNKAGVERRDVKRHAEYLVSYKYDGL
jgi:uncharacterized protein YjiS (DUF1127 family)